MNLFMKAGFCLLGCLAVFETTAAEVAEKENELILQNDKVAISFNKKDFTLRQIRDRERKADFIQAPNGKLFTIALWDPKNPDRKIMNHPRFSTDFESSMAIDGSSAKEYRHTVSEDKKGRTILRLNYLGNTFKGLRGTVDVTVTVALGDEDGVAEWRISMDNRTKHQLYEVRFPRIEGIGSKIAGSNLTDYLILPVDSSEKISYPRVNAGLKYFYPNCMSMQLTGYCDGKGGTLYYAAHDPDAYRKEYIAQRAPDKKSFMTEFRFAADQPGFGKWEIPYPTMIGVLSGDWYDAAKYYRAHFADKTWKTFAQRDDVAPWFRDLGVWVHGGAAHWDKKVVSSEKEMDELVARLLKLRGILGEDFGFHWYVWHKHITFDQFYPDYLPARPDFLPAVTKLEAAGVHCMPYVNSHYFDRNLPEWHDGLQVRESVIKDIVPGRHDLKIYNMVTMCHGTEFWRNRISRVQRELLHFYPVSAVYMDEIAAMPELCYAVNHDHKGHGGNFYAAGQRNFLGRIRKAAEWNRRRPVITGEGMTETHIGYIDGSISGHVDMNPNALPMFQAVHSDRIAAIGLRMTMDEIKDMDRFMAKIGRSLTRGKQLGWFETFMLSDSYDLTLPEARPAMEKLKECTALRRAGQEFLFFGELLRPPQLTVPYSEIGWDKHIPFTKPKKKVVEKVPEVYAECYVSPQGNIGIVLANRTAKEQKISIPWNSKDWKFKTGDSVVRTDYRQGKWEKAREITLGRKIDVVLPPYTPVLVKLAR
ncbi:MAG: DUF6259 domain-containing protein [Victivallales bacterium]